MSTTSSGRGTETSGASGGSTETSGASGGATETGGAAAATTTTSIGVVGTTESSNSRAVAVEQTPAAVSVKELFCLRKTACQGLRIGAMFNSPGSGTWTLAASVSAGEQTAPTRGKPVIVRLGAVSRSIGKAGTVTFTFRLAGTVARRLYNQVKRQHLRLIVITLRFSSVQGGSTTLTRVVGLKA